MNRKIIPIIVVAALFAALTLSWIVWIQADHPDATKPNGTEPAGSNQPSKAAGQEQGFNKRLHETDEPSSPWMVINKQYPLPDGYAPEPLRAPDIPLRSSASSQEMQLRNDAAAALEQMVASASRDNLSLMLASGYRSFGTQQGLYARYVSNDGQAAADRYSARPGHSEHQSGLAADVAPASGICLIEVCFADTPEGQWVMANAHKYGFIIRYPNGKESIVGYMYEPWHLRYVGSELAAELHRTGQTMEEYFDLPAAPDY